MTCFVLPRALTAAGDDYATLGVAALQATGAELVFCLGGGEVTRPSAVGSF